MELLKSGSSSSVGCRQCSRDKMLHRDPQAMQLPRPFSKATMFMVFEQAEIDHGRQSVPHFELCLDDVAEHMFTEKVGQTQKRYMRRNLRLVGGMTIKEWAAQVSELNRYLKDFLTHNKNKIQPLDDDKLLDILEYGVLALWHREFTVQGFDPVDQ
eukprot:13258959-Ditylum_brightwellii.AAC.1